MARNRWMLEYVMAPDNPVLGPARLLEVSDQVRTLHEWVLYPPVLTAGNTIPTGSRSLTQRQRFPGLASPEHGDRCGRIGRGVRLWDARAHAAASDLVPVDCGRCALPPSSVERGVLRSSALCLAAEYRNQQVLRARHGRRLLAQVEYCINNQLPRRSWTKHVKLGHRR